MSAISIDIFKNKHILETIHHTENRKNEEKKLFFNCQGDGLKV